MQGVSLPELRDLILGDLGSYVNLTFLREKGGEGFRYDLDLIRGEPSKVRIIVNKNLLNEQIVIDECGIHGSNTIVAGSSPRQEMDS